MSGSKSFNEKNEILCHYYQLGSCSKGKSCKFSHDPSTSKQICKFFLKKDCKFGKSCVFLHEKVKFDDKINEEIKLKSLIKITENTNSNTKPALNDNILHPKNEPFIDTFNSNILPNTIDLKIIDDDERPKTFSSVLSSTAIIDNMLGKILCPYHLKSVCNNLNCKFIHGSLCQFCLYNCLYNSDDMKHLDDDHLKNCSEKFTLEKNYCAILDKSKSLKCSICLENIIDYVDSSNRFFGILDSCDHVFCLKCIRNWRKENTEYKSVIRLCPICRVVSNYVIPSKTWPFDHNQKKTIIDQYKKNLRDIKCKYFIHDVGCESCPFGSSCFYKHQNPDGSQFNRKPKLRYMLDADGDIVILPR